MTKPLLAAVDAILSKPITESSHARADEIATLAEDAVLTELADISGDLDIPADFISHFRQGRDGKARFLELFGVYVAEQLKHNAPFRSIFVAGQLSRLESIGFEGRVLIERLEGLFADQLNALAASVQTLDQRSHTTELTIRAQGLSIEAIRASIDRLLSASPQCSRDIEVLLARVSETDRRLEQLPEHLSTVLMQHIRFRDSQAKRERLSEAAVENDYARRDSTQTSSDPELDTLDDVAAWVTRDHRSRWSSRWLDSLNALRTDQQIDTSDFQKVISHVISADVRADIPWATLEDALQDQGAVSRSLTQTPASSLHAYLRLSPSAGRLVQILTAVRLGVRLTVAVQGIEFVLVPPGSVVTKGASEPLVNHVPYFLTRSPIDEPTWSRVHTLSHSLGAAGKPKTGISAIDVREAVFELNRANPPGVVALPSAAELMFAFDADECAGLGLVHPSGEMWHLCAGTGIADRFEVVRPRKYSTTCRLDWPNDAARHHDVGARLVFRPSFQNI